MKIYKIILVPLTMLLASCGNKKEETITENKNAPTVLVCSPEKHLFDTALQISGTTKPNQEVKLFAMTNGYLKSVKADIGDFVKEGQTLAILDNPELFGSKAKLVAEYNGKKAYYDRLNSIYLKTPQLTTIVDVEKAKAEYESLKAQISNVQSQINFLNVKAPFPGIITNRFVDVGAVVQSGLNNSNAMPLFEIQDMQPLRLVIDVAETNAVSIAKNTKAEITFPEMENTIVSATVSRISYGLDQNTKTMKIEIDFPNKDLKIRSGMYAKVAFEGKNKKEDLGVPNEAIGSLKGKSFVYIVDNNKVKKVEVTTGVRDEKFTQLLNSSIKNTDKIVIKGKEFCSEGAIVQTKELVTK